MFKTLAVLIPTRGRVAWLSTLIESFYATTAGGSSNLVFRVDEDDVETRNYLATEHFQCVIGPRLQGYASLPVFFNELAAATSSDVLMLGNDDMVFRTPNWDKLILEEANKYPDGIFNIGVTTHNADNFPFSTVSKALVKKLGFIFDPRIFWGDIYLRGVTEAFGRAVRLPSVVIDHDWAGFHPDRVFLEGEETRRADWMRQHQQAVDEAVEKLRVEVCA